MDAQPKTRKSLQYYARAIHRVLGFLTLALVMVYALSGITLIHRTGNFMKEAVHVEKSLEPGLDASGVGSALHIRNFRATDETDAEILFDGGRYDKATGQATYVQYRVVQPMRAFIDLHRLPDSKNRHIAAVTTIFGVCLFLLALTSLFMYKSSAKQFKFNMIYTAAGVVVTVILLLAL